MIKVCGKTVDGKDVVSGAYTLVSAHGISIEILMDYFSEKNIVIDWIDFINQAVDEGANLDTVVGKISESAFLHYGRGDDFNKFMNILERIT